MYSSYDSVYNHAWTIASLSSTDMLLGHGCTDFLKPRSHIKIQGGRRGMCNKFQTENPQMLGTTLHNLDAMVIPVLDYPRNEKKIIVFIKMDRDFMTTLASFT